MRMHKKALTLSLAQNKRSVSIRWKGVTLSNITFIGHLPHGQTSSLSGVSIRVERDRMAGSSCRPGRDIRPLGLWGLRRSLTAGVQSTQGGLVVEGATKFVLTDEEEPSMVVMASKEERGRQRVH